MNSPDSFAIPDVQGSARPPSVGYRVRKFVRRHKGRVAATAAFLALLIAAVGVSSWLAVQAKRAEAIAEDRRIEAEENAGEAERLALLAATQGVHLEVALQGAEFTAVSRQVDLDLVETRTNPQIGFLRLAHTIQSISGEKSEPKINSHDFDQLVNASHIAEDYKYIAEQIATIGNVVAVDASSRYALLAVQGPRALDVLQPLTGLDLASMKYYWFANGEVASVRAMVSRTGYTGEVRAVDATPPSQKNAKAGPGSAAGFGAGQKAQAVAANPARASAGQRADQGAKEDILQRVHIREGYL